MSELNVNGLTELHKALQQLPEAIEKKYMRAALRAGANVIKKAAQSKVPVRSGALRKSIKVKTSAKAGRYRVHANVVAGDKTAYYAHMVEYGTAAHLIKSRNSKALAFLGMARPSVEHPGAKPKPFMRPALDSASEASVRAVADYLSERLAKDAKP